MTDIERKAAQRAYFVAYRARPGYKERTAERRREKNTRQQLAARMAFEASLRIGAHAP